MFDKKVLVIGGPTGCGESTITNEIIAQYPIFKRLVTATTREKRLNEKDKADYYFMSKERFEEEIKKGNIIEHTYVPNRGVYYGSYKLGLEEKISQGFNVIVNPDVVGAKFYKKNYNATTIFIKPDSIENLKKRIIGRDESISSEELSNRLKNAQDEIDKEMSFYDFVVVNEQDKLDKAVEKVVDIIKREGYKLTK